MGLTIDRQKADERFSQALALALSDTPLPAEWLLRTKRVGKAGNKTFVPVLGTALLAKATDRFVDVFSLRESESHKSYSARSVAKEILVPCCVRAGINIRNRGAEPLNNQPFLRADRISTDLNVRTSSRPDLVYLCECLTAADFLEDRSALEAFAAFLRARIEESGPAPALEFGPDVPDMAGLLEATAAFMAGDSEGGKTGQAFVAAALDLVFPDVRTKKINDPSSRWPGDVGAFNKGVQTLGVEVKQRAFSDAEVLLFGQRLHDADVRRGMVVGFDQAGTPLDTAQLAFQSRRLHQVEIVFVESPTSLLQTVCAMAIEDLPGSLAAFPRQLIKRMIQLEVSDGRLREWVSRVGVREKVSYPEATE